MSILDELELEEKTNDLESKLEMEERNSRRLQKENEKIKRISKKVVIAGGTLLSIIGVSVGSMAHSLYSSYKQIKDGKDIITKNVYESCMYDMGWRDYENGFQFNIGDNLVDYSDALDTIKLRAKDADISDVDLYIGISDMVNNTTAETLVGEISKDEINNRAYEVYLNKKLESVKTNGR